MHNTWGLSRRRFCQIAGGTVLAKSSGLLSAQSDGKITAREVVRRIHKNIGLKWRTPTADDFKIGNPDAPISGITTTFMSTLDVLQRSHEAGNNFVISHEPTFWSANDEVSVLRDDPLYRHKVEFIERNKMVVWRFHDFWHAHRPENIFSGWNKALGWDKYVVGNGRSMTYQIPEVALEDLARMMSDKLSVKSIRIVGDPKLKVRTVGNGGHYIAQCMQVLPLVDVLVVFESREWEAAEYVRDAIASGQKKALIQLPHEGGEEAGMDECAKWLRTFVSEVPISFIPSQDPFWIA